MPLRTPAGRSAVTRRAIADIVRPAVRGSYGIVGFATPSIAGHLVRLLGLGEPGIRVVIDEGVSVDLHLRVASGLPVAEVARQVDSAVRYALRRDLGRQAIRVTIHVDGIDYRPARISDQPAAENPSPVDGGADAGQDDIDTLSQRVGGAA